MPLAVCTDIFLRQRLRFAYDKGMDSFTQIRVRHPDDGSLHNLRMCKQDFLHFTRIDIVAADNDNVLLPVHYIKITLFIHFGQVPCIQPPVFNRSSRFFRQLIVPLHYIRSLDNQFPNFPRRELFSHFIHYLI